MIVFKTLVVISSEFHIQTAQDPVHLWKLWVADSLGRESTFSSLPWTYKAGYFQAVVPIPRRGFISTADCYNMYVLLLGEVVILELNCLDSINRPHDPNNCKSTLIVSFFSLSSGNNKIWPFLSNSIFKLCLKMYRLWALQLHVKPIFLLLTRSAESKLNLSHPLPSP